MANPPISPELVRERIEAYRSNNLNVSATARQIGVERSTLQSTLRHAVAMGILSEEERHGPNTPNRDDYLSAKARKVEAFQRKQRKGDWRKPVMINLPNRPFRLKIFGDPHLDSDGCDYELFERHWLEMDASEGIYGVSLGDVFDNWPRVLGHLWKETTKDPHDAWLCFEYLMQERGDALLAGCSGNHDDFSHGPADPVDLLMKRHGVVYRKGAVRVVLACGDAPPIFVALRHKWRGSSIYSPAHGIVRAAIWGWRDHIMAGGHTHVDEPRMVTFPDGFHSHACQVSAFKKYDTFADVHGFLGPKIQPVWDIVVQPNLPDTNPDKFKIFWNSDDAQGYLEYARSRAGS